MVWCGAQAMQLAGLQLVLGVAAALPPVKDLGSWAYTALMSCILTMPSHTVNTGMQDGASRYWRPQDAFQLHVYQGHGI